MKQFEKWWNEYKYVFISTDDRIVAENTWKSALEWVLTLREQELYTTLCDIEQELND